MVSQIWTLIPAYSTLPYVLYSITVDAMAQNIIFDTNKVLALIKTNNCWIHWIVQQPIGLLKHPSLEQLLEYSTTNWTSKTPINWWWDVFWTVVVVIVKTINSFKIKETILIFCERTDKVCVGQQSTSLCLTIVGLIILHQKRNK